MCGIIGYIGQNKKIVPLLTSALEAMEYRGYDSAGIATIKDGASFVSKKTGEVSKLINTLAGEEFEASIGIGHTRWATHGEPSDINAHPHCDFSGKIYVVHNGTIENFREITKKLEAEGIHYKTATDTESIAHLIGRYYAKGPANKESFIEAFRIALTKLEGTFALAVMNLDFPEMLLAAKRGSPALIGVSGDNIYVASDPLALSRVTVKQMVDLEDDQLAILSKGSWEIVDYLNHKTIEKKLCDIEYSTIDLNHSGYETFMEKEICEQPQAIADAVSGRYLNDLSDVKLGGLEQPEIIRALIRAKRVVLVACGTSFYAAKVGEYLFEEIAGIPAKTEKATEFAYRDPVFDDESFYVFLSQSGETADTKESLKKVKQKNFMTLGIVNVVGSDIARKTDAGIYLRVGPEIAVASTKAFTSQVAILLLMAIMLGKQRHLSSQLANQLLRELQSIPGKISKILEFKEEIKQIAEAMNCYESFIFLGRKYQYPVALEGALKLKEIAYVTTEGFPAGELKHGPLALIDTVHPTIMIIPNDGLRGINISNLQEIKARGGKVFVIGNETDEDLKQMSDWFFGLPETHEALMAILSTVPLQLFAYNIARLRNRNVDKPRNLAKSVTVK